jgi:2-iminobutanoate/2-iminopropanoate deaminase
MKKQEVRTAKSPLPAGPYSQGVIAGKRLYISGQRPEDVTTGKLPRDLAGQARQCLDNIRHILEEAGACMDNVVMVTVYLADLEYFAEFNGIYKQYFEAPYPARTTIGCSLRGMMVEVNAIAEL